MIEFLKYYIPYYANYKKQITLILIGVILVSIGTSGTAYVIQPLLDDIFISKNVEKLYLLPFLVVFLYSAKGLGRYWQGYYTQYVGEDILRIIQDKLLTHTISLDLEFFNKNHGGKILSRITNDVGRIKIAISSTISTFIQDGVIIIGLVGVVIYQSPQLAFYGLVIIPLAFYPLSILAKRMKKISFSSQEKNSDVISSLNEIFNNIEIIKSNHTNVYETDKFKKHNLEFFKINIKGARTNILVSPLMEVVGSLAVAGVIIIGGEQVIADEMSVGVFFSFLAALFMLYTPIKSLSVAYNKFQDALAAHDRVRKIFLLKPKILDGKIQLKDEIKKIEFDNVFFKYDNNLALNGISFDIQTKNNIIAFVGDSGSGKSTLVSMLVRFYDCCDGMIKINNKDIKSFDINSLRNKIAFVTQRVYVFNDSIVNNVAYGQKVNRDKVIKALEQAHCMEFVSNFSDGIDTVLEEFGSNLSGGQRQRITLARAFYKQPDVIILDEATSALDNKSESLIIDSLSKFAKTKLILMIAHRLSSIKLASKIVVLKQGKIVGHDSREALLKNCEEYQHLHQKGF